MSENKQLEVNRKVLQGTVVSTKMQNTITVLVQTQEQHPKYKKYILRSKKFLAHVDNDDICDEGDTVEIESCRPRSKRKAFTFKAMIKKANA